MAPGPKKKNFNRRGGENQQDNKKVPKPNVESKPEEKNSVISTVIPDIDNPLEKKYNKRSVTSNWIKYDEPVIDPHADSLRGKDFEVLLSYSGGSNSQLQLQDEKEWDDVSISDKSITLDLQDLARVLKSIPFHKRIDLTVDIFDDNQLEKFTSYAEKWKSSYFSKDELLESNQEKEVQKSEIVDIDSDIIESYESDAANYVLAKPLALEEKTENIIESLASCLSLKNSLPEKTPVTEIKTDNATDDLDFLLSLSISSNNEKQEKSSVKKQTNVDDWLNSILDD